MNGIFVHTEWNSRPPAAKALRDGRVIVTRNVTEVETPEDGTVFRGESCVMTEAAFAAYSAAREVAVRREQEIFDDTVAELIKEGVL